MDNLTFEILNNYQLSLESVKHFRQNVHDITNLLKELWKRCDPFDAKFWKIWS